MYDAGNMTNHSQNPTKIAYCVMCKSNAVMSEEVTLDSARYVKGVALVGRGQGFCKAESQAESYQQCECDITVMQDYNWDGSIHHTRDELFPCRNVKHARALPPTASNRSSHITVTLWTLPRRSNDQDI